MNLSQLPEEKMSDRDIARVVIKSGVMFFSGNQYGPPRGRYCNPGIVQHGPFAWIGIDRNFPIIEDGQDNEDNNYGVIFFLGGELFIPIGPTKNGIPVRAKRVGDFSVYSMETLVIGDKDDFRSGNHGTSLNLPSWEYEIKYQYQRENLVISPSSKGYLIG